MSVCSECCVLSGRGLCDGPITCPEDSYRVWCVWLWFRSLKNEGALAHYGCRAIKKKQDREILRTRVCVLFSVRYILTFISVGTSDICVESLNLGRARDTCFVPLVPSMLERWWRFICDINFSRLCLSFGRTNTMENSSPWMHRIYYHCAYFAEMSQPWNYDCSLIGFDAM
jgi:hypothetical protein